MDDYKVDEMENQFYPEINTSEFLALAAHEGINISPYQEYLNQALVNIRSNNISEAIQAFSQIKRLSRYNAFLPDSFFNEVLYILEDETCNEKLKTSVLKCLISFIHKGNPQFINQHGSFFEILIRTLFEKPISRSVLRFLSEFMTKTRKLAMYFVRFDYLQIISHLITETDNSNMLSSLMTVYVDICKVNKQVDPDDVLRIMDYLSTIDTSSLTIYIIHVCNLICKNDYQHYFLRLIQAPVILEFLKCDSPMVSNYVLLFICNLLHSSSNQKLDICNILFQNGLLDFVSRFSYCLFKDDDILFLIFSFIDIEPILNAFLESDILERYLSELPSNGSFKTYQVFAKLYIELIKVYPDNKTIQSIAKDYINFLLDFSTTNLKMGLEIIVAYTTILPKLIDKFGKEECYSRASPEHILDTLVSLQDEGEESPITEILIEHYSKMTNK